MIPTRVERTHAELMRKCWETRVQRRCTMAEAVQKLEFMLGESAVEVAAPPTPAAPPPPAIAPAGQPAAAEGAEPPTPTPEAPAEATRAAEAADGTEPPAGADGAEPPEGADGAEPPKGADGAEPPEGADGGGAQYARGSRTMRRQPRQRGNLGTPLRGSPVVHEVARKRVGAHREATQQLEDHRFEEAMEEEGT